MRFKTGIPPRVARDSIDFLKMEGLLGDVKINAFSSMMDEAELNSGDQVPSDIEYTNVEAHEIVRDKIHR